MIRAILRNDAAIVIASVLVGIITVGTVFFHFVEGWSWIDSYFFTVVTLSTVGYGQLVPATAIGKIATTVFIFVGLGIFAAAIQQFSQVTLQRRLNARRKIREAQDKSEDAT
ncbi:potassium channel family protein [Aestuariibius sp. HNIBRBA575]|uniref:potassium channel family protein n=1 Tax=Aestuariibius sp. HNIBRBA575 TaxID=3233343 RepID=UPI0034A4270B